MSITPLMPVYPRCGVRPVRGEGAYLIGERGERYLDFASGIRTLMLCHKFRIRTLRPYAQLFNCSGPECIRSAGRNHS